MMLERVPFRLNFWMTACAIPVLMLLIGLGVWQLQRLEWKQALIAERVTEVLLRRLQSPRCRTMAGRISNTGG